MLWAAWTLSPPGAFETALDGLLGFATHSPWSGKRGRKSSSPAKVTSWVCSVCKTSYELGDPSHNSPTAGKVNRVVDDILSPAFTRYGRVVMGLPSHALPWQRLMCNNFVDGHHCWRRGGVLVPRLDGRTYPEG